MSDPMPYGEGYYMPCGFFTRDEIAAVMHMEQHAMCDPTQESEGREHDA
jgi:hypothetical protein